MSEIRKPDKVIIVKRLIFNAGQKQVEFSYKYELFRAIQFKDKWDPRERGSFSPAPPLNTKARNEFWKKMYRVRVDGKWSSTGVYEVYPLSEIMTLIGEDLDDE